MMKVVGSFIHRIMVAVIVAFVGIVSIVHAQDFNFLNQNLKNAPKVPGVDKYQTFDVKTQAQTGVDNIIKTISDVINWVLGLLALASLVIIIYTGVKILLDSGNDKAIGEGYKTIKNVFIALLFIGASWLIVQGIFYVVKIFVGA